MTDTGKPRRKPGWCEAHHQPRIQCDPDRDTHVHTVRTADGLMARVAAKARAMGVTRNEGMKLALEAWTEAPADPSAVAETAAGLRARLAEIQEMSPPAAPGSVPFREPAVKR
jgi:hypothetical protein